MNIQADNDQHNCSDVLGDMEHVVFTSNLNNAHGMLKVQRS